MGFWKGFRSRRTRRGFRNIRRKRRTMRRYIPRAIQPRTKLVKAHTVDYHNHAHTNGAIVTQFVQQNSIDDTWGASGGQQVLGYDQWKALYKKAIVLSSKVTIYAHNNSSQSVMIGITAVPFNQGNTGLTTYEHYMECPNTTFKLLSPDVDRATLSNQVSTKKLMSLTNIKDNRTTLEIDLNNETPPTNLNWWHIWTQPQDQATTTSGTAVQLTIKVTYLILLIDPIIPARSAET